MKLSLFISLIILSVSAFAYDAELTLNLEGEEYTTKWKTVKLSSLNAQLKRKGLPGFEDTITLSTFSGKKDWAKVVKQVAATNKALKREIEILDNGYLFQAPSMCYTGTTASVIETVNALRGSVFHEDMGISLVRYGKNKLIFYEGQTIEDNQEFLATHMEENPAEVKLWKSYDTKSDTVLILGDLGPQGDGMELHALEIPRCK